MCPFLITPWGLRLASAPIFAGFAALAAYGYFALRRPSLSLSEEDFWGVITSLAAGVFGGAVGFYAVLYGGGFWRNIDMLLRQKTLPGGSFLGAYLGAVAAAALYCRRRRLAFAPVGDTLAGAAPLGLAVMRLGCLLNGCCYGRPTDAPWGLVFHGPSAVPSALRGIALHPTQLYESAGSLLLFAFVDRGLRPSIARGTLRPGDALFVSVAGYGLLRFVVDFWRAGDPGLGAAAGLTMAQWLALAALVTGAARFAMRRS